MLETALLTFALATVAAPPPPPPPPQPAKAAKKSKTKAATVPPKTEPVVPKTEVVQQDPRFGDFARGVLKCYHPTARYQSAAITQRPWPKQAEYDAKAAALISIEYVGISNANYTMTVGVLAKPQALKTVIQSDTAKVHAYENCELANWVEVK